MTLQPLRRPSHRGKMQTVKEGSGRNLLLRLFRTGRKCEELFWLEEARRVGAPQPSSNAARSRCDWVPHCSDIFSNQRVRCSPLCWRWVIAEMRGLNLMWYFWFCRYFPLILPSHNPSRLFSTSSQSIPSETCRKTTSVINIPALFPLLTINRRSADALRVASCAFANLQPWLQRPGCRFHFYKNRICIGSLCTHSDSVTSCWFLLRLPPLFSQGFFRY